VSRQPTRAAPVTADPVELFFDLAYVFAIARLVGYLHDDLTLATTGRGLLLLALLWWGWSQFTWAANAVGNTSRPVRLAFLGATVATLPLAASLPGAYTDAGLVFAVAYAAIRVLGIALYWVGVGGDAAQREALRTFAAVALIAPAVVIAGGLAEGPVRVGVWAGGLAVELLAALRSGRRDFRVAPTHFAERYGLFVIVALGESVVAVGAAVAEHITAPPTFLALAAGGTLAALLWWSYFDHAASTTEAHLHQATGPARARLARDLYTVLHFPIAAGIVLVAVALEEAAAHPTDLLPLEVRQALAAGLALFLGGFVLGHLRATRHLLGIRLAALALTVAAALAAPLPALGTLLLLDAVLLAALAWEHRTIATTRAHRDH
jgi:low temperature requirement protein LtrA